MSLLRKIRYAWYTSFAHTRQKNRELRHQVQEQVQALWNRNELIADQDQVITELRGENRTLQQDVSSLRGQLEATAAERDYWQGKAANP